MKFYIISSMKRHFEGTKGLIRSCKSKDRQQNGQKKQDKRNLQNTRQKTKDRATSITNPYFIFSKLFHL
jgi:hypothetical protein